MKWTRKLYEEFKKEDNPFNKKITCTNNHKHTYKADDFDYLDILVIEKDVL